MERKRKPGEAPGAVDSASLGEDRKSRQSGVEGEGSYTGSKAYNERTKKFIDSGKVDDAARKAAPQSEEEAHQMHKAERIGKQRAKGEDPALRKK